MLCALFGPDFSGPVAPWWCYLEAFSYLMARILDEMDGKQARKTGNSSPLGLLFDHGCDAFSASMITMMLLKVLSMGNNTLSMLVLGSVLQSYYFCTLEEYYIGGLYLGMFNGVTDGSVLLIAMMITAGATNQEFFTLPRSI